MPQFVKKTLIPAPPEEVFRWHARPGALERLSPPWDSVKLLERRGGLEPGSRVTLSVGAGPLSRTWVAEHGPMSAGRMFSDRQLSGPFAQWDHVHRFEPSGDGCMLEDRIEYELPFGIIGRALGSGFVRRKLESAFEYRHRVTASDIAAHLRCEGDKTMRILITGASGLVGTELKNFLTAGGHEVKTLGRGSSADIQWNIERGQLDADSLEGFDAVVHLAGANVGERWTKKHRESILESRVQGTALLCRALAKLKKKPQVLVCASAVGIYGDRGDEELDEHSSHGQGFLASVCRSWESSCQSAIEAGIRVVNARFGIVLSPRGGALKKLLLPFKLGLGTNLGSGRQFMSWVSIDDAIGAIHHALVTPTLSGPVNVTAPAPVTNREFTRTLGRVLFRPVLWFLPWAATALPLMLIMGEMAQEMLLGGSRVLPRKLETSGYKFRHPTLESALRHVLGRRGRVDVPATVMA